jgi:hypothetical protein
MNETIVTFKYIQYKLTQCKTHSALKGYGQNTRMKQYRYIPVQYKSTLHRDASYVAQGESSQKPHLTVQVYTLIDSAYTLLKRCARLCPNFPRNKDPMMMY